MKQVNGQTAEEISKELLVMTERAMLDNDFDALAACFHLPHVIGTADHQKTLRTREELRQVFDRVVEDYRRRRINALVRINSVAEFSSETEIKSTYVTHMMSGDLRVGDPFPCYSVLKYIDGRWLITTSEYAVDIDTAVGRALHHQEAHKKD